MGREIKTNNSETIIMGVQNINQSFKKEGKKIKKKQCHV